ncbi:MAG TPA: riboflavin synthase [Chitinophagaceae bacterium]|nr:riboflavin synthase [Chitinophagaceae bacterium]
MFTGIVETVGTVKEIKKQKGNLIFSISSSISASLKEDQSVSHNGACLTVLKTEGGVHQVEAVEETLAKTNLNQLETGDSVNLERALTLEKRLDGHIVQGHVDTVGECVARLEKEGSIVFTFHFPKKFSALVIEKGSIAVNGISLTAFEVSEDHFSIAVIPYTLEHTSMKEMKEENAVNLEFDMVGKYVLKAQSLA